MKKNVHIVPHTHWDREWDFTLFRSKIYLMKDIEEILNTLEKDTSFKFFTLDGQASLVEDYLNWRPEETDRIKKLVENGKLLIGPWYTQTDQMVASGENIVRNLMYGINYCNSLGKVMDLGYVPDAFGQSGNMPQIYKGFNFDSVLLWRGISDDLIYESEFIWQGFDGSKINAFQIVGGYFIGALIDENQLADFTKKQDFKNLENRGQSTNLYFPNGFDQAPIRKNLPYIVDNLNQLNEDYNFEISNPKKYVKSIEKLDRNIYKGEFTVGKNMRVHKTIYSSRADIKALNTKIQNDIVNVLEPIVSLGSIFGITYPYGPLKEIWKLLFENSSHDSLGSCVNDKVNKDIMDRYINIEELIYNLKDITLREISERIVKSSNKELTLIAFNTLPYERSEYMEFECYVPYTDLSIYDENEKMEMVIDEISDETERINSQIIRMNPGEKSFTPDKIYKINGRFRINNIKALGYKKFFLRENFKKNTADIISNNVHDKDKEIENKFYKICINERGSLDIFDKRSNKWYLNQAILEENGDDGDSFNYSPPRKDLVISSENQSFVFKKENDLLSSSLKIKYNFKVPKNLEERAVGLIKSQMIATLEVKINTKDEKIEFNLVVDNNDPLSHRLCIIFNSMFFNKNSISDVQFATVKRPVCYEKNMKSWRENKNDWNEKPIAIETFQSFISLSNDNTTFTVVPKNVREFEIIGDENEKIRLTLFRTFSHMGKENLLYRPGRASGDKSIETPDAQLRKILNFSLILNISNDDFDNSEISKKVKQYLTPIEVYQTADYLNGRLRYCMNHVNTDLPEVYSLFELSGQLVISAFKKAEGKDGYILRLYQPLLENYSSDIIHFKSEIKNVYYVNLLEEKEKEIEVVNNSIEIKNTNPGKILSIYFEL